MVYNPDFLQMRGPMMPMRAPIGLRGPAAYPMYQAPRGRDVWRGGLAASLANTHFRPGGGVGDVLQSFGSALMSAPGYAEEQAQDKFRQEVEEVERLKKQAVQDRQREMQEERHKIALSEQKVKEAARVVKEQQAKAAEKEALEIEGENLSRADTYLTRHSQKGDPSPRHVAQAHEIAKDGDVLSILEADRKFREREEEKAFKERMREQTGILEVDKDDPNIRWVTRPDGTRWPIQGEGTGSSKGTEEFKDLSEAQLDKAFVRGGEDAAKLIYSGGGYKNLKETKSDPRYNALQHEGAMKYRDELDAIQRAHQQKDLEKIIGRQKPPPIETIDDAEEDKSRKDLASGFATEMAAGIEGADKDKIEAGLLRLYDNAKAKKPNHNRSAREVIEEVRKELKKRYEDAMKRRAVLGF